VKFIKKLLQRFKSSQTRKSVRPAPKPKSLTSGAQGPKNGRLTLAVISAAMLTILLTLLTVKLIHERPTNSKVSERKHPFNSSNKVTQRAPLVPEPAKATQCGFYYELTE
jgi:hypothetical protein